MDRRSNEWLLRHFCLEIMEELGEMRWGVWYWISQPQDQAPQLILGIEGRGQLIHDLMTALRIGPKALAARIRSIQENTFPSPFWPGAEVIWDNGRFPCPTELVGWTERERDWLYFLRWQVMRGGFDDDQGATTDDRDWYWERAAG